MISCRFRCSVSEDVSEEETKDRSICLAMTRTRQSSPGERVFEGLMTAASEEEERRLREENQVRDDLCIGVAE